MLLPDRITFSILIPSFFLFCTSSTKDENELLEYLVKYVQYRNKQINQCYSILNCSSI